MQKEQLKVHTENMLPIIKKWLYTDRDIFLRELVSNATDALHKLELLKVEENAFRIQVDLNTKNGTLTIADNGVGMSREEVEKYIAQIAFSSAEEFLKKYADDNESESIIGHFGLGFYSAFMVADRVTIDTQSHRESESPVFWSCDGSNEYEIGEGKRELRGTTITLFIGEEQREFLDRNRIQTILKKYCSFLPYPLFLDKEQINKEYPLWIKPPAECEEKEYKSFYRALYPMEQDPLFWIHLNVDYPFHLKGILYFPKGSPLIQRNEHGVQLYCNRVFVSDHCRDILPEYLTLLHGVIESPDIPLNVSRSSLQVDQTVRQLSAHISKKMTDYLKNLYESNREKFVQAWPDIEPIIKMGAMQEEKFFERIREVLIWKNEAGNWTTIPEYLERNQKKLEKKIFYFPEGQEEAPCSQMYREQGIEILCIHAKMDTAFLPHMESKWGEGVSFVRIDSNLDFILDEKREKSVLDAEGKTMATRIADFFRLRLKKNHDEVEVQAKSLLSDQLPAMILFDETARRMRDYFQMVGQQGELAHSARGKHTLVLNTNHPLIAHILKLKNSALSEEMALEVYQLALASQGEMGKKEWHALVLRTQQLFLSLLENTESEENSTAPSS